METTTARRRPPEPRILYGRIAVYAASLLLAFVLGTVFGGRGQPPESELAGYRAEVAELRRDNYELEQQVAAYAAGQVLPPGSDEEPPAEGEALGAAGATGEEELAAADAAGGPEVAATEEPAEPPADLPPGARTYEVQAGDTLTSIAEAMYGDGAKYGLIASANGVDAQLEIGQELVIPPEPEEAEEPVDAEGAEAQPEGAEAGAEAQG